MKIAALVLSVIVVATSFGACAQQRGQVDLASCARYPIHHNQSVDSLCYRQNGNGGN